MERPRRRHLGIALLLVALVGLSVAVMPTAAADKVIVVKAGDTLSGIALAEGVTVQQLVDLNGLADAGRIRAGQRLTVRRGTSSTAGDPGRAVVHRVVAGESLWLIAEQYQVSMASIAAANHLSNPRYLRVGQRLTIPRSATPAGASSTAGDPGRAVVHRVVAGESLWLIAERYQVSMASIAAANHLSNPRYLRVGQRLTIPGTRVSAGSTPAIDTANMTSNMRTLVLRRAAIGREIASRAVGCGVPVAFALAVAWQESGWQQGLVSSAGAVGVMQLTPATAQWVNVALLGEQLDPRVTIDNIHAGVCLLRHYFDRYDGNKSLVMAAYYQGQRATDLHGVYLVTRPYIASILALEAMFGG